MIRQLANPGWRGLLDESLGLDKCTEDWEDRSAEGWYWSNKEDGTERFYRSSLPHALKTHTPY